MSTFVAFDLGASNGRCIIGRFDGERLNIEVAHRFENGPVELNGRLYWDVLGMYSQVRQSLLSLNQNAITDIRAIGLDTWGCDFALLDPYGKLVSNPYTYRDPHTSRIIPQLFSRMSKEEIFDITGLQFIEPNSLVQLFAMKSKQDPVLQNAATFLHISDLLHYWLTGRLVCEYTNASTSQIMNACRKKWSSELLAAFELDPDWFPDIIPPGEILGKLRPALLAETGLNEAQVVATATHDTAAAITAIPVKIRPFSYISSGTWALLGKEIDQPLITSGCLANNIANEGGAFDKITLLKNITSLWLVQECRRQWALERQVYSWDDLVQMAEKAEPFIAFIDPDDPSFSRPGDMPQQVQRYCAKKGQTVPHNNGQILRVIFESLAFKYRYVLDLLEKLTDERSAVLYIIGGGSRNSILNQFSANACCLPVQAGPSEATAIGNILVQMYSLGELNSQSEARELVHISFTTETFLPHEADRWNEKYQLFLKQTGLGNNGIIY